MRGKMYKAKVIAEGEELILKIIRLKVQNPRWHEVDEWLNDLAETLRVLKAMWR